MELRRCVVLGVVATGAGAGLALVGAEGCSADANTDQVSSTSTTSSGGGTGGTSTTSGQAGSGGSGGTGAVGAGGSGAGGGAGGLGGTGGSGGTGGGWPDCLSQPQGYATKTIPQIWQDDPAQPTAVWLSGVVVTAVSRGDCQPNQACQIFLQQNATYGSFAAGAQHGIKLFASGPTAVHFDTIAVGDVVDVAGHAWRYNLNSQNELLVQVNAQLPGCAHATGTDTPVPITGVTLPELTVQTYEQTHGPLLIQMANVSGSPSQPTEVFGLWETGVFSDAGIESVTSLSPFFLPGAAFTGLTQGQTTDFDTLTGVFGLFVPPPNGPKYEMLYPRTMADVVLK